MNNCVFVTHATLDADKAKYSLKHLTCNLCPHFIDINFSL